jgi:hypothetical protein
MQNRLFINKRFCKITHEERRDPSIFPCKRVKM